MTEQLGPTPEEAVPLGLQSPDWNRYSKHDFYNPVEGDGEALPLRKEEEDGSPVSYEIITRYGERCRARPIYASPSDGESKDAWLVDQEDSELPQKFLGSAVVAWRKITPLDRMTEMLLADPKAIALIESGEAEIAAGKSVPLSEIKKSG